MAQLGNPEPENEKVTVTDNRSNNSGVWRLCPKQQEASGGLGAEPPTLRKFFQFFSKK